MAIQMNVTWSPSVSLDKYHGVIHETVHSTQSFTSAIAEVVSLWLLTLWRPEFDPNAMHVGFAVDTKAVRQDFPQVLIIALLLDFYILV
jgi:hypothetical protein